MGMWKGPVFLMPGVCKGFDFRPLCFSVFAWRNHGVHVLTLGLFHDCVAIITTICQKVVRT